MAWSIDALLQWATEHPGTATLAVLASCFGVAICQPITQWRLRKIPGSRLLPIIGDLPNLAAMDMTFYLDKLCAQYSTARVFKIWVGPRPYIIVRDVDLAKKILHKFTFRFPLDETNFKTGSARLIWSNLLLELRGAKWRLGRRATESAVMHPKTLAAQAPVVAQCAARLVESLDRYAATEEPFDAQVFTFGMAMDAVGWATFGVELHATTAAAAAGGIDATNAAVGSGAAGKRQQTGGAQAEQWWLEHPIGSPEFGQRLVECAGVCMRAMDMGAATVYTPLNMLAPRLYYLWAALSYILPDERLTRERKAMRGVTGACKVMMDAWKQQQLNKAAGGGGEHAVSEAGFLARLLSGEDFAHDDTLTDYEVVALVGVKLQGNTISGSQAMTNVVAGYHTSGSTIAMSLYYLACSPEAQRRAQQEVDTVLQGKDPLMEDLDRLPWINAVFQESMRLASPASAAVREASEPYDMGDGIVYSYHRYADVWSHASEFLPERHVQPGNESLAPTNPNAFMPFGTGARMCVGYKFATLEVRMALTRLMQRFTFTPAPGAPAPVLTTGLAFGPDKVLLCVQRRGNKA